jgi:hypothetical protein
MTTPDELTTEPSTNEVLDEPIDETGELREIVENDSFISRILEYLLEKLNDFTDCMGCTDSG